MIWQQTESLDRENRQRGEGPERRGETACVLSSSQRKKKQCFPYLAYLELRSVSTYCTCSSLALCGVILAFD
ncbi:uncharacterized protein BO95DRAFT_166691 [Aspergillus brunneoviolaceus CBS 621.78]|uniref:Uncharacterized protein n=1 Tax=Aspergillus brunneoviolaceus CBS 621.78 TaxID=1450534 RepID=A0ACD1G6E2_9EURO|nr:hypothetical protein BO95DRAFT_166691 [Aspergillus brunneoviolaceus CBS 621.78]RAH44864.1 hypothetical protein BO95DRAFT_166691 [Aspergillus brunneoviolaceus CBS 621.78]